MKARTAKKSDSNTNLPKDPKKENLFNELTELLRVAGYEVRREKLKAGPGWKVVSGSCTLESQQIVFVDRRLSQDDQILFLASKISSLNIEIPLAKRANLSAEAQGFLPAAN